MAEVIKVFEPAKEDPVPAFDPNHVPPPNEETYAKALSSQYPGQVSLLTPNASVKEIANDSDFAYTPPIAGGGISIVTLILAGIAVIYIFKKG